METHLVLPSWWVRAYEAAALGEGENEASGAMEQACQAGLAPAFAPLELNALAMVLTSLQAQLLSRGSKPLVVSPQEHLKHAGTAARSRLFVFEKVIQILTGVRLLVAGDGGELRSHALFARDRWTRPTAGGSLQIEVELAVLGSELLLGLSDAHLDLARRAAGDSAGGDLLGPNPPLAVWRSVWLELLGPEQVLLLRMERSMQWEFRWLQLEGVFGLPMAELFRGLRLPETRAQAGELARKLRVLARLGRKLCAHGFLATSAADQYLALDDSNGGGLNLVWQVTRERLASDAASDYRERVCRFFLSHRYDEARFTALARICLPSAAQADGMALAREVFSCIQTAAAPAHLAGLDAGQQSQPILPQALFLELLLRRHGKHAFPVPDSLLGGPLDELTAPHAEGVAERFLAFCRCLDDDAELVRAVRTLPFVSFAAAVTRQDKSFARYLSEALSPASASLSPSATKAPVVPRLVPETPAPAAAASEAAARRPSALQGPQASRMLKIAADELQKMRGSFPDRYQQLRRAYLDSLDEIGRKLIHDVERRMQPHMFEEHLRQRLIRYMVDNPGAYRMSAADGTRPSAI